MGCPQYQFASSLTEVTPIAFIALSCSTCTDADWLISGGSEIPYTVALAASVPAVTASCEAVAAGVLPVVTGAAVAIALTDAGGSELRAVAELTALAGIVVSSLAGTRVR